MKKLFSLCLLAASTLALPAQTPKGASNQVTVLCKITSAPANTDNIILYEQIGMAYKEITRGPKQADESYLLTLPSGKARIYSIGFNETMNGRIILGEEAQVTLYANAQFMEKGRTLNSKANKALELMRKRTEELRTKSDELRVEFRQAKSGGDAAVIKTVSNRLADLGKEKLRFLDSLKTSNSMLWRSATLQLSPDYFQGLEGYQDELEFYNKEFFRYADWNDAAYEETPDVFDAFQNYMALLSQLGAGAVGSRQMGEAQLAKLKPGTKLYRRAMSGLLAGMKTTNHPDFANFAKKYIEMYRGDDLGDVVSLEYELRKTSTFTPGMEVPDLVGNTPNGDSYALSKMKGKVVLIDFWASWCGPCRRENPNVLAMYNKYKDKGFDILGVSLDREENAWKRAIEQDGLLWHHISDLKGWSSEHAKLYSVSSIPQTVLIDKEGKIIQRNLRGEQLGEKLKELFGE